MSTLHTFWQADRAAVAPAVVCFARCCRNPIAEARA
jgi:hypothetical protein